MSMLNLRNFFLHMTFLFLKLAVLIARNKAVKEYRKAKRLFEKKLPKDSKNNPKGVYAYVRLRLKL